MYIHPNTPSDSQIQETFKCFRHDPSYNNLVTLADQLSLAHRANHSLDIMRSWLKTSSTQTSPENLCCIAQRFAFLGEPEEAIALIDRYSHPEYSLYQTWLIEKAWAHFLCNDFAAGRALWQKAMSQPLIHDFLHQYAPSEWSTIPKERYLDAYTSVRGKSVRILWDAGIGDCIQNIRYIRNLHREGATKIYMDIYPPLVYLLRTSGFDVPDTFMHPLPSTRCDYFILHQTLFARYEDGKLSKTTFPYITPGQPGKRIKPTVDAIRQTRDGRLKVAFHWRSVHTSHRCEPYRSMGITDLLPILSLSDINFYSCTYGDITAEEAFYLQRYNVPHIGGEILNLHDLACVYKEMDLVISVDSAPVHLAGAMNIPVYALFSTLSEWRWGRGSTTSFLYPSLRLFRQKTLDDWQPPVNEIAALLTEHVNQIRTGQTRQQRRHKWRR